jgi:hypothetical protein
MIMDLILMQDNTSGANENLQALEEQVWNFYEA